MLSFLLKKVEARLKGYYKSQNYWNKWVESHNIDDLNLLFFSLVKKRYGSLNEVKEFDTDEIMQILEYEYILNGIEQLEYEESKNARD